jgi:hypothetical protein
VKSLLALRQQRGTPAHLGNRLEASFGFALLMGSCICTDSMIERRAMRDDWKKRRRRFYGTATAVVEPAGPIDVSASTTKAGYTPIGCLN